MEWEEKYARVVSKNGHHDFFERFLLATNVKHLVIISPWITNLIGEKITLVDILKKIRADDIKTTIFMRHPKKEPINMDAVQSFRKNPNLTIYFNNELHAKIYVCRCDPFGFALVSSANLSGQATRSLEIGVLIEGKGYGKDIINELEMLGREDLPNRSGSFLHSRDGLILS